MRGMELGRLAVLQRRAEFEQRVSELKAAEETKEQTQIQSARNAMEQARQNLEAKERVLAHYQRLVDVATAAEEGVAAFAASVTAVPASGGSPPLTQAALREVLPDSKSTITHILHVSVATAGGESQIRQRRFFSPVVRYIGACTFDATLASVDGTIVYASAKSVVGQLAAKLSDNLGEAGTFTQVDLA